MKKSFIIILIFLISCTNSIKNYDDFFSNLSFRDLEGNKWNLNNINKTVIIINFYSPTCAPCIEELPALHMIYQEAKRLNYEMFLAIEPDLEKNLPFVPENFKNQPYNDEIYLFLRDVIKQEIKRRNISIPVYIFEPPFRIDKDQIITGTPETLIFTTQPLRLRYNFIGPIATTENIEDLKWNTRYQFFIQMLNTIHQNTQKTIETY